MRTLFALFSVFVVFAALGAIYARTPDLGLSDPDVWALAQAARASLVALDAQRAVEREERYKIIRETDARILRIRRSLRDLGEQSE